jgi:hypothetical protein
VVHGDVSGIEAVRRALADWLDWMGLIDAGERSQLDRMLGYYAPYATSHEALDADTVCRRKCATSRAHWPRPSRHCARAGCR